MRAYISKSRVRSPLTFNQLSINQIRIRPVIKLALIKQERKGNKKSAAWYLIGGAGEADEARMELGTILPDLGHGVADGVQADEHRLHPLAAPFLCATWRRSPGSALGRLNGAPSCC